MGSETLEQLIERGNGLLSGSDAVRVGFDHQRWVTAVRVWLSANAPESGLSAKWAALGKSPLVQGGAYYDDPIAWAKHSDLVRYQLRWLGDNAPDLIRKPMAPESIWTLLHPDIVGVGRERFKNRHYADAVEAAFKHVNAAVKAVVVAITGEELDGASLMKRAFSPNKPIIVLDDLGTASGRDSQLGYMEIFAGSMTGIRNPKAHGNIEITPERAIHHLFLASLLMYRLSERVAPAA